MRRPRLLKQPINLTKTRPRRINRDPALVKPTRQLSRRKPRLHRNPTRQIRKRSNRVIEIRLRARESPMRDDVAQKRLRIQNAKARHETTNLVKPMLHVDVMQRRVHPHVADKVARLAATQQNLARIPLAPHLRAHQRIGIVNRVHPLPVDQHPRPNRPKVRDAHPVIEQHVKPACLTLTEKWRLVVKPVVIRPQRLAPHQLEQLRHIVRVIRTQRTQFHVPSAPSGSDSAHKLHSPQHATSHRARVALQRTTQTHQPTTRRQKREHRVTHRLVGKTHEPTACLQ